MSTTTRFRVGRLNLILHSYRAQFGSLRETFVPLLESWSHYALLAFFESSRRIDSESQAARGVHHCGRVSSSQHTPMLPRNPSSEHYIFLLNQLMRPRKRLVPGAPLFASALSATTNFVETRDVDPFNWLSICGADAGHIRRGSITNGNM